ncbi:hypothetical protein AYI68_g1940 [Smittium mucronatum]|uniref:Uncharacterized protein n=1 Tax=Smittium mucronatum TaxID=133383 RepID=A0A1R0H450_9FUNG|nr:hypothetical protein AYI68_g1940 [Smittium mucronatum]
MKSDCVLLTGGTDSDDANPWRTNNSGFFSSKNEILNFKYTNSSFYESNCRYNDLIQVVNDSEDLAVRIFCFQGGQNVIAVKLNPFKKSWLDAAYQFMCSCGGGAPSLEFL